MIRKLLVIVLVLSVAMLAWSAEESLPAKLDSAIDRSLDFLAQKQNADGSFDGGGPKLAMTGLTLMSFLACGHTPDVGKHGVTVRNAIDYLVQQSPEDGYFGRVDGSRMYGQGIVTLALSEACGVERDAQKQKKMRQVIEKAVKVILDAQAVKKDANHSGGWRYEPQSQDSDLSLSGWNALALRSARNIGVNVPKERIEAAVKYVLKCYRDKEKGFAYQPGNSATSAMTGVGLLNLYLLDAGEKAEVKHTGKYLVEHLPQPKDQFYYYSVYYSTQAAFQAGEPVWGVVWKSTHTQLLGTQMADGGWPASSTGQEPGRIYATAMATLSLAVPYRLLPIYQK